MEPLKYLKRKPDCYIRKGGTENTGKRDGTVRNCKNWNTRGSDQHVFQEAGTGLFMFELWAFFEGLMLLTNFT